MTRALQAPQPVSGKFPKLTTILRAEVLATMLAGDDVSGIQSVFSSGSTKLATVMRALTRRYRWPIECREFAINAAGGQGDRRRVRCRRRYLDRGSPHCSLKASDGAHAPTGDVSSYIEHGRTGLVARKQTMKTKAKIVCRADGDFNTTAAKLLIMAGNLMVDASPDTPAATKDAARVFVEGVISAAATGGYTKANLLRDALGSGQRPNRLAVMAHDACKAAGHAALAGLIAGGVS